MRRIYTPTSAASGVEDVLKMLEGRWKLIILFHLFDGNVQRFSDFEKLFPGISQKMLAQQLRQLEADGIVARKVYPQVPPKVEYRLTEWGQALCPALDAQLKWAEQKDVFHLTEHADDASA
ncbi:winged helix-turn-helix transcriptional regulator [Vreelandella lionensis]|uniref:winged helix-turn-helix transcriptional regulator n=1 Tax=Vreelandella lionensis TaxID=1144478 RepID=UPI0009F49471|nr:helix-turn-helix domain-containing protein [Halomonas lionensis]